MDRAKRGNVLMIFTRLPIEGKVKTRLIPGLGSDKTTELYISLINNTFNIVKDSGFDRIQIWFAGDDQDNEYLKMWKNTFDFVFLEQYGNSLGERMFNAFSIALDHFDNAVIIGCDCPELNIDILRESFEILKQNNRIVMGPSEDGGYYLLGLNNLYPSLFSDISWGSEHVASITREKADDLGLRIHELQELWDVDRPEDVERLRQLWPALSALNKPGHLC